MSGTIIPLRLMTKPPHTHRGKLIQEWAATRGYETADSLAKTMGVTRQAVNNTFNKPDLGDEAIYKYAKALKINPDLIEAGLSPKDEIIRELAPDQVDAWARLINDARALKDAGSVTELILLIRDISPQERDHLRSLAQSFKDKHKP